MTTRDIPGHREEMYGVAVSPTLLSHVTEAVPEEVRARQSRPLDPLYPIVYWDALLVKRRDNGVVQNVNGKERRTVAQNWRAVYQAAAVEGAEQERELLAARRDRKYPTISTLWRRHGEPITPLFAFPPEIRKIVYTTNAVESLHRTLRKVIKTRGSFPNEEAARKLLYLALRHVSQKWGPLPNGKEALHRFALLWEARFPQKALQAEKKD